MCPGLNEQGFTLERPCLLLGLLLDSVGEIREKEIFLLPFSPRFKDLRTDYPNPLQGMILSCPSRAVPAFTRGQLSPSLLLTSLRDGVRLSDPTSLSALASLPWGGIDLSLAVL